MSDENSPPISCPTCEGQGCEEGCGNCQMANAGPESHKVCTTCGGTGVAAKLSPIRYMDMAEFRDKGFLQESNRQFFHPLGLALEWDSGFSDEGVTKLTTRLIESGKAPFLEMAWKAGRLSDTRGAIMEVIQALGLDRPRISGVWDYRDDPEGMQFDWGSMDRGEVIQKWVNVSVEFSNHVPARRALFGEKGMEQSSAIVTSVQSLPKTP